MIGALLLNLRRKKRDADAGSRLLRGAAGERNAAKSDLETVAAQIQSIISGKPQAEPLKQAVEAVTQYVEAVQDATPAEVFENGAIVQMRVLELQQLVLATEQQIADGIDYLALLERMTAFLNLVQDDEEAILVLLLTE